VFLADPDRSASRYGSRGRRLYSLQDATIAATFSMLAAEAVGLGTCWVGAFSDAEIRRAVRAPDSLIPVAILTVGRPAEVPSLTPRRPISEIASLEVYGRPFPHRPVRRELIRPTW